MRFAAVANRSAKQATRVLYRAEQFGFLVVKHTQKKFNFHIQSAVVQKKLVSKHGHADEVAFPTTGQQQL